MAFQDSIETAANQPKFSTGAPDIFLTLGPGFDTPQISRVRSWLGDLLASPYTAGEVGKPVPEYIQEAARLVVSEWLTNGERPDKGRHATSVQLWLKPGRVEVGVGDSESHVHVDDGRSQTTILEPDINGDLQPDPDELDGILAGLEEHGLGQSVAEQSADMVGVTPPNETDPEAGKIMRALFFVATT